MLYSLGCVSVLSEIMQCASWRSTVVNAYKYHRLTDPQLLIESVSQPTLEKSYLCLPGLPWFLLLVAGVFIGLDFLMIIVLSNLLRTSLNNKHFTLLKYLKHWLDHNSSPVRTGSSPLRTSLTGVDYLIIFPHQEIHPAY